MNKKILIANWKMNPKTADKAVTLARAVEESVANTGDVEIVIAPPFVFLSEVKGQLSRVHLGAQNVFWEDTGPYTGEVSVQQLKNLGIKYAIIGHSERRQWAGETDEIINKKVKAVLKSGLTAILCVGEPKEVRDKGIDAAKEFVKSQLKADLAEVTYNLTPKTQNIIIAYEPVWAIGTGNNAEPTDAAAMAAFIKSNVESQLSIITPVLYGGSTNSKNIAGFLEYDEIDGALVGGASLNKDEFVKMVELASGE